MMLMTENKPKKTKSREEMRFDREAKALQKNLEKRKKQAAQRDLAKKEESHGQDKD